MVYYVLHSPYPDRSWRGIEKCVSTTKPSNPRLFESEDEALGFAHGHNLNEFIPVPIRIEMPRVRAELATWIQACEEANDG